MPFCAQIQEIGGITLSKQCKAFSQFLCERIAVFAGFDIYSERLVCIQAALFHYSSFWSSGSQGWNPLASCVSEHSNLNICNAEIPSLLLLILSCSFDFEKLCPIIKSWLKILLT